MVKISNVPKGWTNKSELFHFSKGEQIKGKNEGDYPHYNGGRTNSNFYHKFNVENSIIISEGGVFCGFVSFIKGRFWAGGHCYVVTKSELPQKFLYYLLKNAESRIMSLRVGSDLKNIQKQPLKELKLLYPKNHFEQQTIATTLSDMDEYIASLEKLIEKKKAIKVGAMQELLTSKRRLPGFTCEWLEKPLSNIVLQFSTGLNPRNNFKLNNGGSNYYVTIKNFSNGRLFLDDTCDKIDDIALSLINNRSDLRKDDILFSSIGRVGDAFLIKETPKNWNINESVFALRSNKKHIVCDYLYYLLKSELSQCQFFNSITGSTLSGIKLNDLKQVLCSFPKQTTEQTAIAKILCDMDAEIDALNSKLAKARDIKTGMMQQLLTGQIRLVDVAECEQNTKLADAIILARIVYVWGQEPAYPLGRVKVAKLFYLYTRKMGDDISRFKELAAGPYDPTIRHGGGEPLAVEQGFITVEDRGESSKFTCGEKITEAVDLLNQDQDAYDAFAWLEENFVTTGRDELELLATVDCARVRIEQNGGIATPQSIKNYIQNSPEWNAKLNKDHFNMAYITEALKKSRALFG